MIAEKSGLWPFAIALYARPGVGEACLELQDRYGANIPLVLSLLWLESLGAPLDRAKLDALSRSVVRWQREIVEPLRAVRKRLKEGPPPAPDAATAALRDKVKAIELEAERIEMATLERLALTWTGEAALLPWLGPRLAYPVGTDGREAVLVETIRQEARLMTA